MSNLYLMRGLLKLSPLAFLLVACTPVPIDSQSKPVSTSIEIAEKTFLGRLIAPAAHAHADHSGFLLLDDGAEAYLWRAALVESTISALDAQYFIWADDNAGRLMTERLLSAAEKGVRVRLLLDDFPLNTIQNSLALLDAHPNIEIRVYNPLGADYGSGTIREMALLRDFKRLNRRMHNKVFVADGSIAIIGGRNIGDQYFDMHPEFNFRDRDVLAAGPVVREVSASFDAYWNSQWSASIRQWEQSDVDKQAQWQFYERLHQYAADPKNQSLRLHAALKDIRDRLYRLPETLIWGKAILVYDIPGKNDDPDRLDAFGRSGEILSKVALQSRREILSETPYLFLMPGTFEGIAQLKRHNVRIRILTNSLASTDLIVTFAGYAKQREQILHKGVELYEFKSHPFQGEAESPDSSDAQQKPGLSLHAKTAVFDRQVVYIGSFNLDPRSAHLNTEIGLLIYSDELARQVADVLEDDMMPTSSWRVELNDEGQMEWISQEEGREVRLSKDPLAKAIKRMRLRLYSLLPLSAFL